MHVEKMIVIVHVEKTLPSCSGLCPSTSLMVFQLTSLIGQKRWSKDWELVNPSHGAIKLSLAWWESNKNVNLVVLPNSTSCILRLVVRGQVVQCLKRATKQNLHKVGRQKKIHVGGKRGYNQCWANIWKFWISTCDVL